MRIKAEFEDSRFEGKNRDSDLTLRKFECKALISDRPSDPRSLNGGFGKEEGQSHVVIPNGADFLELETSELKLTIFANEKKEISMVHALVEAMCADDAKVVFENQFSPYVDYLSFLHSVPLMISMVVVRDVENEIQYLYFVSPPRHSLVNDGNFFVTERMRPIYALYRESQNAQSPYHRILSLFKIMEGLLSPLRVEILKDLRKQGLNPKLPKLEVPQDPGIAEWLKDHVGKPIGVFVNDFLTKEYRNAIAHFELRGNKTLDVGSPEQKEYATHVAYIADLCARELIIFHEKMVQMLRKYVQRRYSPDSATL